MSAGPPIPDELWQQIPPAAQAAIRALIQHYEHRLAELEARLKQNSTNSSKPPSSDPPSFKRAPPKSHSTKKAGGQYGHAKVQRELRDPSDRVQECKPAACRNCQQSLQGDDPYLLRHQVWDIPPLPSVVTEYRRLRCPRGGITTCGQASAGQDGVGLKAASAMLTGAYRLSKAKAARFLTDLFAIPLGAGQVRVGRAADEQCGGACLASWGVVAENESWSQERGGIKISGVHLVGGVETCRQQGQGVRDFLTACMAAAADGRVLPSLLTLPHIAHAA